MYAVGRKLAAQLAFFVLQVVRKAAEIKAEFLRDLL